MKVIIKTSISIIRNNKLKRVASAVMYIYVCVANSTLHQSINIYQ